MKTTTIDTSQLEKFRETLQRSPERLRNAIQRAGVESAKTLEHHLRRQAPKFMGELSNSIEGSCDMRGGNAEAIASSSVPYALIVDTGRKPGKMPPEEPIRRWVELKLFKRGGFMRKKLAAQGRKRARTGERQREINSLVYLIRRKIGREGTKPTHYIDKGLTAATPALKRRMEQLKAEVVRMLG